MAHEKYMVNREKYKEIKRFDHKQMEKFCYDIYVDGVTKGRLDGYAEGYAAATAAAPKLEAELLEEAVLTAIQRTKGIGLSSLMRLRKACCRFSGRRRKDVRNNHGSGNKPEGLL